MPTKLRGDSTTQRKMRRGKRPLFNRMPADTLSHHPDPLTSRMAVAIRIPVAIIRSQVMSCHAGISHSCRRVPGFWRISDYEDSVCRGFPFQTLSEFTLVCKSRKFQRWSPGWNRYGSPSSAHPRHPNRRHPPALLKTQLRCKWSLKLRRSRCRVLILLHFCFFVLTLIFFYDEYCVDGS